VTTGTVIIERALEAIGAHSVVSPAMETAIVSGKEKLNSMLETWLSYNIEIGFVPLAVPPDNLNEPADTTNGIINNLALELAPSFDNGKVIVSPQLERNARIGYAQIKNLYQRVDIPAKGVSATLPRGAGSRSGFVGRVGRFFGRDQTLDA
jgi:hypothetical protein